MAKILGYSKVYSSDLTIGRLGTCCRQSVLTIYQRNLNKRASSCSIGGKRVKWSKVQIEIKQRTQPEYGKGKAKSLATLQNSRPGTRQRWAVRGFLPLLYRSFFLQVNLRCQKADREWCSRFKNTPHLKCHKKPSYFCVLFYVYFNNPAIDCSSLLITIPYNSGDNEGKTNMYEMKDA